MRSREKSLIKLKRFQVDEKRRQVTSIEMMMADMERMAADLQAQVESEEKKSGISDITHFAYPTFAKAARTRAENIEASILELREKLEPAQDELAEAVEELKKAELLHERDNAAQIAEEEAAEQAALDEVAGRHAMIG
ncbi:MAG: flagellar export protein FliJ [Pseudomonadota bacterium]